MLEDIVELPGFKAATVEGHNTSKARVVNSIKQFDGFDLSAHSPLVYRAIRKAKASQKKDLVDEFGKLPSFLTQFAAKNTGSRVCLQLDAEDRFLGVFFINQGTVRAELVRRDHDDAANRALTLVRSWLQPCPFSRITSTPASLYYLKIINQSHRLWSELLNWSLFVVSADKYPFKGFAVSCTASPAETHILGLNQETRWIFRFDAPRHFLFIHVETSEFSLPLSASPEHKGQHDMDIFMGKYFRLVGSPFNYYPFE